MSHNAEQLPPVRLAVVTGRHPFDVRGFAHLFRSLEGVDAYTQHMEDFSADAAGLRDWYDVVVFYNMHSDTPTGEGAWYEAGMLAALERLGRTSQGILVLHHALLAFLHWPFWSELVGIEDRHFGYHVGETITAHIQQPEHPITRGLADWTMVDETYTMGDPAPDCEVLLTTEHPRSMRALAWTRRHGEAPVLCLQSGHDNQTWSDETFRAVFSRGIHWLAGRL